MWDGVCLFVHVAMDGLILLAEGVRTFYIYGKLPPG